MQKVDKKKEKRIKNKMRTTKYIDTLETRFNGTDRPFLLPEYLTVGTYNRKTGKLGGKVLKAISMKDGVQQFKRYMLDTNGRAGNEEMDYALFGNQRLLLSTDKIHGETT